MNKWYLRDTSRKIKASKRSIGISGVHLSAQPLYGYEKGPEDKHRWLVDEEASSIVKRMFRLVIEGNGPSQIATIFRKRRARKTRSENQIP